MEFIIESIAVNVASTFGIDYSQAIRERVGLSDDVMNNAIEKLLNSIMRELNKKQ